MTSKDIASDYTMIYEHLVFVYGTLKRSFYNHYLISGTTTSSQGLFVGVASTLDRFVMVVDDRGIPFLLNAPSATTNTDDDQQVHVSSDTSSTSQIAGELYRVHDDLLAELDVLEGYPDFYTRRQVQVKVEGSPDMATAWVYIKSDKDPVENAEYAKRQHVSEYTPEMHLHYIPPPMRVPSHSLPALAEARRPFEAIAVRTALCEAERVMLERAIQRGGASGASNDAIATSSFALLDAGCGAELAVLRAAMPDLSKLQIPARVLCVDGLSSAEQRAREKMAEIVGEHETTSQSGNVEASMLCADLCALGAALGAKRFNVVSCFGVLFHIPRSLHRQVLLDLYRALQPGGELVLGLASEAMDDTPLTTCNGTPPTTSPTTSNGTISSSSSESEQATSPTLKCSQFHPDAYVALMEECEFEIRERSGVPMSQVTDATRQVLPKEIGLEVWSVCKPEL